MIKNKNKGLRDAAQTEKLKKEHQRNLAVSGFVGLGAGITTGVVCRKKMKYGIVKTILLSLLANGGGSAISYYAMETINPTYGTRK